MPDTLTQELEAINTLLSTIGEAPINSLSGTLPADVNLAVNVLKETRRKVCSTGWWFNQDKNVQSTLDANSHVILATNVMRVEMTCPTYGIIPVQRGAKLWDSFKQTFVFDKAPKLTITYLLDWTELPEQARQYIMHRAARIFQARSVGAPELDSYASRDELMALAELRSADTDAVNRNIFNSNGMRRIHRFRRR